MNLEVKSFIRRVVLTVACGSPKPLVAVQIRARLPFIHSV